MTEPWVVDTNVGVVANDRLDDRPDPPHRIAGFDPADGKFIRTALGCPHPRIAEAVDGLWWKRRADFEAVGITVNFLCPEIKANNDRKHGPDLPR